MNIFQLQIFELEKCLPKSLKGIARSKEETLS